MVVRVLVAVVALVVLLVGGVARADEPEMETPKDVAKVLKKGLRKNDNGLIGAAVNRAKELKKTHEAKDLMPIAAALETAIKTTDSTRHYVALGLFEHLAVPGSYKYFKALLKIPDSLKGTGTRNARAKAIMVAATVGRAEALPEIRKLLDHPDVRFAKTAVWAMATYTHLEPKPKTELVRELVEKLAENEKNAGHKKADVAKRAKTMVTELNKALATLTGKSGATTSKEWAEALAAK